MNLKVEIEMEMGVEWYDMATMPAHDGVLVGAYEYEVKVKVNDGKGTN